MTVHVAWAGIDRDALLDTLTEQGFAPRMTDEDGEPVIEVPCADGDTDQVCADVLSRLEALIAEHDLPLVPERGDDHVYIRPPAA